MSLLDKHDRWEMWSQAVILSYSEGNQCEKEGLPLKEKDKQGLEEAQGTVVLE